jgi:glutaredoxin-related protein
LNFLEENIANGKISNYIPTTEIFLPMREKLGKLTNKGCYMIFMRGKPDYPTCQGSMKLMELLRNNYRWVIENPIKPELQLEYFDLSRDENIGDMLYKFAKFGEIP